ncbi:MMPL family transporter [Cerasicoccus frondis]|uniref:MMPL family transporter n=1 Tax=Cerasicoccus frondis TaxID=490090 RepID=UPI002852647E|nr:MMPL family transporter [Cerasicoccus frondis]
MSANRPTRRTPWLAIIGLLIAPLAYLITVDWSAAINDNILELLPQEHDSADGHAVREMLNERLIYPIMLKVSAETETESLVSAFRKAAQQPGFSKPYIIGQNAAFTELKQVLLNHRETFFADEWITERQTQFTALNQPPNNFIPWLAEDTVQRLNTFLDQPESLAYASEIPVDPLLLLPSALDKIPAMTQQAEGSFIAWIPLTIDPLTAKNQATINESLEALRVQLQAQFPNYQQEATGVYKIAAESATRIKREMSVLNSIMAIAILALLLLFTRRTGFLLLTTVPVAIAVLWCIVMGLLAFGHIHVIALAVSSVVLGLAVDYAVHLAAKRGDGNLLEAWRNVRLPLIISCLSTCIGFSFLLLSPISALKQVGVMAPSGLIAALLAVRYLLPWLEPIAGAYHLWPVLERPLPNVRAKYWAPIVALLWLSSLLILIKHKPFNDDITDFQTPMPEVIKQYRALADSISHADVAQRWYVFAESPVELAKRLRAVEASIDIEIILPTGPSETLTSFASQSSTFASALKLQLEEQDFTSASFRPFFGSLAEADHWGSATSIEEAYRDLAVELQGPLQALLMTNGDYWAAVIQAPYDETIPQSISAFTRELSRQKTLNLVLEHARQGILRSAVYGLLGIVACVMIFFRKKAFRTMAVPVWAVTLGLAVTGLGATSIGLLAAIGAVLAFCLALDYGAFTASTHEPPASIRISAATTFTAFLILSLCSMPAISQLGQIVAITVFFAWLMAELLSLPDAAQTSHVKHDA